VPRLREGLARCTGDPACPRRFSTGGDRLCADHAKDTTSAALAAEALGITIGELAATAPGDRASDGENA